MSKSHVYTLFERLGVRRRSQRHKYDISAEWLETRKHLSSEEIAAELGCKPRYVWTLFKEFGIERPKRLRPASVPRRDCPCGPCASECMARALLPVCRCDCEVEGGSVGDTPRPSERVEE